MESGIDKRQIITELTKSAHGNLAAYAKLGRPAAMQEPEFWAHLVAWDAKKGSVRDAHVALPVLALAGRRHPEFDENALAHLAKLDPRNLVRASRFAKGELRGTRAPKAVARLVAMYLRQREAAWGWWERAALQHRESMKELYALHRIRPAAMADRILFKRLYPPGTVFEDVVNLKTMTALQAAGTIVERKIPFLVARGAMGARFAEPEVMLALIERMSPTELVTNAKAIEKFVEKDAALRAALSAGLDRASKSKANTLKTTRAAEVVKSEVFREKLKETQERQIERTVAGDWAVLADKSGSMASAIETARHVAAILARSGAGRVYLIFFDTAPRFMDVSGKSYEEILKATRLVSAAGGTSIGCAVQYLVDAKLEVDGIAIVSDGGENSFPLFTQAYARLCKLFDREPAVYLYECAGEPNRLGAACADVSIDIQTYDLRSQPVDYYSLPNLVQTMRASRYSLLNEIMETPLLTLADVFKNQKAETA